MRSLPLMLLLAGSALAAAPAFAVGESGTIDPTDTVEPASSFLPTSDRAASLRQAMNAQAARDAGRRAVRGFVVTGLTGHLENGSMSGTALKYTDVSNGRHDYDLSLGTWRTEPDGFAGYSGFTAGGRLTLMPLDAGGRQVSLTGYVGHSDWSHNYQLHLAADQHLTPALTLTGNLGIFTQGADWGITDTNAVTAAAISYRLSRVAVGMEYSRISGGVDNGTFTVSASVRASRQGIVKLGRTNHGVYSLSFGQQVDVGYSDESLPER